MFQDDCADVYKYGNWNGNGEYHVKPLASSQPFEVHCRHVTSTRTYIMQRKKRKNRESFDRSWADYKDGFGNLEDDFWLGLEKIHKLTNVERSYKLRITIKFVNNSVLSYIYDDFKVTNETTGYRLQYNKVALNDTGDCFYPLLGAPFSTYDHDRDDNQGENCAKTRKGGFWYRGKGCSTCNPHGIVYGQSNGLLTGAADEAFWSSLGELAPFKINMHIVSYDVE
ncbi:microfibril-associated glycoprotein 4-like [Babylonia areolata]|uniref:microfibril-associated glycoprotein 4-like n=1 Tax=Babylonia areolata TaxID=304850 RepID=UPI003FD160F5